MKKKITAALSVIILSAAGFGYVAENNFADINLTKVEAAQNVDSKFSVGGIYPGMSFDEVKKILGEPVNQNDDAEFVFSNGLVVEVTKNDNIVKELEISKKGLATDAGISVGMSEKDLLNVYGNPSFFKKEDGKTKYKYHSSDGKCKIEFKIRNGIIEKIESELCD